MSPKDERPLTWEELPQLFPELPDASRWVPLLQRHLEMVEMAAPRTRVTAVRPVDAVRRHYAESLEILRVAVDGRSPGRITDVGSGGGYPGLVMAIVLPTARVALVEPLQKRARLLSSMVQELGIENAEVHPVRAEDAGRSRLRDAAELVTARAVAPLAELLEYTAPLAAPGGTVALPKGSGLEGELAAAGSAVTELRCVLERTPSMRPEVSGTLRVAVFRKLGPTPPLYPRRVGVPGRRPLKG